MTNFGTYEETSLELDAVLQDEDPRQDDAEHVAAALAELRHLAHAAPVDWAAHSTTAMLHLVLNGALTPEGFPQSGRVVQLAIRHGWNTETIFRLASAAAAVNRFIQDPTPEPPTATLPISGVEEPYQPTHRVHLTPAGDGLGVGIGISARGDVVGMRLDTTVIAADHYSGKTDLLRRIVIEAALDNENVIWAMDHSGTFSDSYWRSADGRSVAIDRIAATEEQMIAMCDDVDTVVAARREARSTSGDGDTQTPSGMHPRLVVVIDDLESIPGGGNGPIARRIEDLIRTGRSENICCIIATSDVSIDTIPAKLRKSMQNLIVGQINDPSAAALITGSTAPLQPQERFHFQIRTVGSTFVPFAGQRFTRDAVEDLAERYQGRPWSMPYYQGYDPTLARRPETTEEGSFHRLDGGTPAE